MGKGRKTFNSPTFIKAIQKTKPTRAASRWLAAPDICLAEVKKQMPSNYPPGVSEADIDSIYSGFDMDVAEGSLSTEEEEEEEEERFISLLKEDSDSIELEAVLKAPEVFLIWKGKGPTEDTPDLATNTLGEALAGFLEAMLRSEEVWLVWCKSN